LRRILNRQLTMGSISSGIGLVSGIDSSSIIEQLMQLERRPIRTLQGRIAQNATTQLAFTELSTRLNSLKSTGSELRKPSTFEKAIAASSDDTRLTANARPGATEGSYQFRVARLVSSQQVVSARGFASADRQAVGAGSISLELGDARLQREALLDDLRGGIGIRRGVVELTDRSGRTDRVDLGDAVTLDDVIDRINDADVDLKVSRDGDALRLRDISGGTGDLRVRDVNGFAAEDLGLMINTGVDEVTGRGLSDLHRTTLLSSLNDGRGVATGVSDGLSVTVRDGTSFDVDLSLARTLEDAVDAFADAASAAGVDAALEIKGRNLEVADRTNPLPMTGTTTVTGLAGSTAANELGLVGSTNSATLVGDTIVARPGGTLLSSLNGGSGLDTGTIRITNRAGTQVDVDLTAAVEVADINRLLQDAGANVEARVNSAGNAIDFVDQSASFGTLTVVDLAGSFAADTGLAGTFERGIARGNNLDRAWLNGSTDLGDLRNGRGISLGEVRVTDSSGATATFNFDIGNYRDVQDVLDEFNRTGTGVSVNARINDSGDGIVFQDTAGGAGSLKIEDQTGSTAADLRLDGEHATGTVDGSYEISVAVNDTDSLEDVRDKLNELDLPIRAEVLNAGGGDQPFRLSVSGRESGYLGSFIFDARLGDEGDALLGSTMSHARDAAVLFGGSGANPILATGRTNELADVVPGVTLNLARAGTEPVTISVTHDIDAAVKEAERMVEAFNLLRDSIDDATSFNAETNRRGPLLGEPAVQRVERDVYGLIDDVHDTGNTSYRILRDVGVSIADGAKLEFGAEAFRAAFVDDPTAVSRMFSQTETGFGHQLQDVISRLTDPADGLLTRAVDTIDDKTADFEEQIARVEEKVEAKRQRLAKQFLDMELALSRLQFQQQQLAAIPQFTPASSSGNNSGG
jgi:flagellar hook-associated protein 2